MPIDHTQVTKWPLLDREDEAAVIQVLREGDLSTHRIIRELESAYAEYTGRKFALAHNNGTSALMAAFHGLGLQPGDEILVPTATFWASVLPMLWFGLVPIFCNSEPARLGIDPDDMRARIGPRTKAAVVVHLWGFPAKMTEIRQVADEHGLKIVEDASHAQGARWRGTPCGNLGDVSVFSLQGDKLAPAGEGGMLLTDDAEIHERAICLGDVTRILELETKSMRFAATGFGVKTRMAPMSAALGLSQLKKLDEHNSRRNRNHVSLSAALEELGFDTFLPPGHIERVYFEFIARYRGEEPPNLLDDLNSLGCQVSRPRYPLLHEQPFFAELHYRAIGRFPPDAANHERVCGDLSRTAEQNARLIKLPNFPGQDDGALGRYAQAFARVVGE